MSEKKVDVKDFAIRVERLCDFLLNKFDVKDGSPDITVIQKIKDDAADLQFFDDHLYIEGLDTYIRGG